MAKRGPISIYLGILAVIFAMATGWAQGGERFTDNGDGTVTDHLLGVMWAVTDNHGDISWNEARQWVKYTFPDTIPTRYENWRLPTLEELKSLVSEGEKLSGYEADCGQWVKVVPEIRLSCGWIWTSEVDPVAPTARVFNFNNVYHYTVRKAHKRAYRALPVRDLK